MRIATAEQMRQLDRTAIEERGIPSTDLMERAAEALAQAALELAGGAPGRAVCFCGAGNNGGDGIACARLLLEAGLEVRCILVGAREKLTADEKAAFEKLKGQPDITPNESEKKRIFSRLRHLFD